MIDFLKNCFYTCFIFNREPDSKDRKNYKSYSLSNQLTFHITRYCNFISSGDNKNN